jgi:outer membrane protein assembly factor BamD
LPLRFLIISMKATRIIVFTLLLASSVVTPAVDACALDRGRDKPRVTREERRRERERRASEKATAATEMKVRAGKHPNYNRLLKSTSYELMYNEGLRYYRMKKKRKDHNSTANYRKAQNLFDGAYQSQTLTGTPKEDSLFYYLGASYYKTGDFQVSEQIFDNFRRRFPSSKFIEDVEYMYAMGFYHASPSPEHDQSLTIRAINAISEYVGRYPASTNIAECNGRMDELRKKLYTKSFDNARLYYTIGQYKAAVRALNNAVDEYPASPFREELMYLATKSAYMFAKNSVASQMTDRYMSMMDNYYNLVSEYPETRHLKEVEKMRDEARKHIEAHTKEEAVTTTENGN